jgi:hypothetical protein
MARDSFRPTINLSKFARAGSSLPSRQTAEKSTRLGLGRTPRVAAMPAFTQMLSPTARRALRTWSPIYLLQIDMFDPHHFKIVGTIDSTPHGDEGARPASSPLENKVEPSDWVTHQTALPT